ncbi:hypothetical protein R3P38DRAFT_2974667, partial [Favolaschia claudopus]
MSVRRWRHTNERCVPLAFFLSPLLTDLFFLPAVNPTSTSAPPFRDRGRVTVVPAPSSTPPIHVRYANHKPSVPDLATPASPARQTHPLRRIRLGATL